MSEQIKRTRRAPAKPKAGDASAVKKLTLLVTIVNRAKAEYYTDLLQSFEVNLQSVLAAEGTAPTEARRLLGLTDSERAMIVSVIREERADAAIGTLEEKFATIRGGKGVAFTVPMSSTIGAALYQFLSNNRMGG